MAQKKPNEKKDDLTNGIIADIYKIGKILGSGSFGELRIGLNIKTGQKVGIKFEPKDVKEPALNLEYRFYKMLDTKEDGIPEVYHFGPFGKYNSMVMELLGKSLEDVFNLCKKQFTLKTIIYITLQLIDRIEYIHSCKIVFRDVKPENFLLGLRATVKANIIHIIDFGLAKQYINPVTNTHIPMKEGKGFTGTVRYMSLNAHMNREQSRRDDLESIAHLILYFLKQGKLSWTGLKAPTIKERYQKVFDFKKNTSVETLCTGFPQEFADFLIYSRKLGFEETPDYNKLKKDFIKLFEKHRFSDDGIYDWDKIQFTDNKS